MFAPHIGSRIKKTDELASHLVNRTDITSLLPVAIGTGKSKIHRHRRPAVLLADDMIHLTADKDIIRVDQTILANVSRTAFDHAPQPRADLATHVTSGRAPAPWPGA